MSPSCDDPLAAASLSDSRWALVLRIISSKQLRKSPRLQELLRYLCRRVLDENATEIHEQEIGCHVFGRPAGYDTNQDTIVRVQVSQLRKKMERYFAAEGTQEEVVCEVPKGNYVPVFRSRLAAAVPEDSAAPARGQRRWIVGLALLSLLLAAACAALLIRLQTLSGSWFHAERSPTVSLLWTQLLEKSQRTDIVVADSCLSLLQDILLQTVRLPEYVDGGYQQRLDGLAAAPDLQRALRVLMSQRYTSLADVNVVRRLVELGSRRDRTLVVHHARDYNVRNLNTSSAILLGSSRSNAWVELFDKSLNFRFEYDPVQNKTHIVNRSPLPGEPPTYTLTGAGANIENGYGVLALLPNLGQTGDVLLIAGTDMEGTEAVGQFVCSERYMARLRSLLAPASSRRFPYFEALLKTKRPGAAGQDIEVVAHRLIRP
jgi:hypothetical protein